MSNFRSAPTGGGSPRGLTSALLRYLCRFDGRVIAIAIALILLVFCLVITLAATAGASGSAH